ncbi:unnamed protein product [Strongylus vulgaris]|uniref:Uncharacterized protein n=1 Tax=Strongylus vulgaris TaxID=40348 RepID=A0A3P7K610_STRVU|nr:unnamed protein product [Strongylus vulgaris]
MAHGDNVANDNIDKGGLTFFDRLAEDAAEENSAGSSGVLSSIFGRFWRNQSTADCEPSGSATFYLGETASQEKEDETVPESFSTNNPLSSGDDSSISAPSKPLANAQCDADRTSPSVNSFNSQDNERAPRKLSDKLTNMFRSGYKPGLMDYNRSNFRQYWMPDSTGKECYQCEERFSTFR